MPVLPLAPAVAVPLSFKYHDPHLVRVAVLHVTLTVAAGGQTSWVTLTCVPCGKLKYCAPYCQSRLTVSCLAGAACAP